MLALCLDMIPLQQFQNTGRCSRNETWQTDRHTSDIDRMETIHILAVIDSLDYFLFRNMFRQRKLNDETIHIRIVVQFIHLAKQFFFGYIRFVTDQG